MESPTGVLLAGSRREYLPVVLYTGGFRHVGQTLGAQALAAVGTSGHQLLLPLFHPRVHQRLQHPHRQAFGAHEQETVKRNIAASFVLSAILSLCITVATCAFCSSLLRLMNTPQDISQGPMTTCSSFSRYRSYDVLQHDRKYAEGFGRQQDAIVFPRLFFPAQHHPRFGIHPRLRWGVAGAHGPRSFRSFSRRSFAMHIHCATSRRCGSRPRSGNGMVIDTGRCSSLGSRWDFSFRS